MKKALAVILSTFAVTILTACGSADIANAAGTAAGAADTQNVSDLRAQSETAEPVESGNEDAIKGETAESTDTAVDGGWEYNQGEISLDKNPEAKAAFEKALDGLVGCDYKPIALIGSQVVSGTNYCILCRTTPVVPNATSAFSLVTVYEDLSGKAEITEVKDLSF